MDVVDQMERAFATVSSVLREVRPDQWTAPSPCEGWTVRDVVNHMVGGAKMVSVCLSGDSEGVNFYVDHLRGLDPVETYIAEAAAAVHVYRVDPSLVARTMPMPWGEATGSAVAAMFMGDHFVHTWDVAKATGQSTDLDPEMAELVRRFAHDYVDVGQRRGPEMFDEERSAPAGAAAADRLAAYLGRRVEFRRMYVGEYLKTRADDPLLIMATSGEVVTYRQFEDRANQMAHLYRAQGLKRLDHVSFLFENNPRMLECEAGAERSGLYYTCINSYLAPDEAAYIINDSESRIVVTSAAKREVAMQLPELCPNVERWLMADVDTADAPFESLSAAMGELPTTPIDDEQLGAAMLYSSGTTGQPKGILRPLPDVAPDAGLAIMGFVQMMFRFREGQTYLSPAPLYHSAPQASVAATIRMGGTAVIMEKFDPAQFLDLVRDHSITHSQMVPTMFSRLLKLPDEVRAAADLSSLECIIHAAAPCPVPVKQQMIEWFGPKIIEYYGATEANGFTFCSSEEWLAHPGTVGKCILGELLILDDDGDPQPTGTPGTVWFKGATNFEYFHAPDKTAESRSETGDASTVGDVGYLDEDGYLYLTDRKTYMIISGGVNIYPQETENLLITHPKVMDAAVIGVPNEDLGEEVKAVVQPMEDIEAGPELERELIAFCRENLAHFKCPRTIDFEDELPRLPTGKLYKRLLRDRYWEGHATRIS